MSWPFEGIRSASADMGRRTLRRCVARLRIGEPEERQDKDEPESTPFGRVLGDLVLVKIFLAPLLGHGLRYYIEYAEHSRALWGDDGEASLGGNQWAARANGYGRLVRHAPSDFCRES
jgi:hypothetical protein